MNERITEDIIRDHFKNDNLYKSQKVIVEEQKSTNPRIHKMLKTASKHGTGIGKPEFIVTFPPPNSDFIIIVECKSDISKHESLSQDQFSEYAVDGVKLYSSHLSKEFDVLSIAISGKSKKNLRVSHFLQLKGGEAKPLNIQELLSFQDYLQMYIYDEDKKHQSFENLLTFSRELNNYLRDIDLSESHRPLLVSGILIALQDPAFTVSYKKELRPSDLANNLVATITKVLDQNNIMGIKKTNIIQSYRFIHTHSKLTDDHYPNNNILMNLITDINERVNTFTKTYAYYDVLGKFYSEFLRYANSDKTLGIVLTPQHITELFVELAGVNENSVVLDNCCGTGGFLISAMKKMIALCSNNKEKEKKVYANGLIGIESNSNMFALACSNMMIRGDGKANIYYGDCFNISDKIKEKHRPTIGLLNPPYAKKKEDQKELAFVMDNINALKPNSTCIAIVPMSCAIDDPLKTQLLEKHTLEAVMSMPVNVFHDSKSGTVTCTMIFKTHVPHKQSNKKVWLGYWRDDGFVVKRRKGRIDFNNTWRSIKERWVSAYRNREVISGLSLMQELTAEDEWCIEAFLETDPTVIKKQIFINTTLEYLAFLALNADFAHLDTFVSSCHTPALTLANAKWKRVKINDLFVVHKGLNIPIEKNVIKRRTIVISANTKNNGFSHYLDRDPIFEANTITLGNTGQSSVGIAFYQPYPFIATNNINVLVPKDTTKLNEYIGMFIVSVLKLERYKFSFGRVLNKERTEQLKINIPALENGDVDWQFMENYIKSLPFTR